MTTKGFGKRVHEQRMQEPWLDNSANRRIVGVIADVSKGDSSWLDLDDANEKYVGKYGWFETAGMFADGYGSGNFTFAEPLPSGNTNMTFFCVKVLELR